MTPEKWKRLKRLFDAAIDLPKQQQARFVAELSGEDIEVRQELVRMLEASDDGTGPLKVPIFDIHQFATIAERPLAEDTLLINRFRIVRLLGSGGMGDVYEAVDLFLDPGRVALKVIRPALAHNSQILSRFKKEVSLARHVTGPNICRVHELHIPEPGSGCPCAAFLTMEFLEGETLASRIDTAAPLAIKQASEIAKQICTALQTIHDAQIVHRDLKPQNIMLVGHNGGERVVLMDFGVAVGIIPPGDSENGGLTSPGAIVGTPDYMAPEQFDGKEATPATDVFALGIILYELFTGKHPFMAQTSMGAAVRRGRHPESASTVRHGIPAAWDHVIARCLEYEPEKRFASAAQVLAALRQHRLILWRSRSGQHIVMSLRIALLTGTLLTLVLAGFSWRVYREFMTHKPPREAQEWYDRAAVAFREGTYLLAVQEFKMALARDPDFSLAHARLAEALAELDFVGKAEQEMLIATSPDRLRFVPDEDKKYLEAIRNTLIRNYSAAVQNYEAILNDLPRKEKGHGYVDLGRAYEKAGRIKETIESYRKAAQLTPDDPAPFVHLGIWESRQRDPVAAEKAFAKAESLYSTSGNLEGLAEVAYQRGYAANEAADSKRAREYLDKSLAIARQIPNVQLEVRTLTQLSSVAYSDSDDPGGDDKAIEFANKAIELARENDLEYWSTDGLIRLANAYLDRDLAGAERYAQQAFRLAKDNQHPRLEASASMTLASIRDRQGNNPTEQITYAQAALKYYRDFGFMNAAARSTILILRAQEAQSEYLKASQAGGELLQTAQKTGSQLLVENAEDVLGAATSGLENYPAALAHFEGALDASRSLHENEAYQEVDCADALWRLGRYTEAAAMLASATAHANGRNDVMEPTEAVRAQMQLSQERFGDALAISRRGKLKFANLPAEQTIDFDRVVALSEAGLGQFDKAQRDAEHLVDIAEATGHSGVLTQAQITAAEVYVNAHLPEKAIPLAAAASKYGLIQGQKETSWLAFSCLARAYKQTGNIAASRENAKKAIDILNDLEQSWGSAVFHLYSSRPDNNARLHELAMLNVSH